MRLLLIAIMTFGLGAGAAEGDLALRSLDWRGHDTGKLRVSPNEKATR
jgi:hypothetical protein